MLVLRNRKGAYVEEFYTLKELKEYVEKMGWTEKDYYIVDKC